MQRNEFEKNRRVPFFYLNTVFLTLGMTLTVASPLTLFAKDVGFNKAQLGILGAIPFCMQALGILFFYLSVKHGAKKICFYTFIIRSLSLLPLFIVIFYETDLALSFILIITAISLNSLFRVMYEPSYIAWLKEAIPVGKFGKVFGNSQIVSTPLGLLAAYLAKLWIDSHSELGLQRFYPVFIAGIIFGISSAFSVLGFYGGKPKEGNGADGNIKESIKAVLRDRMYLFVIIVQSFLGSAITIISFFSVVFFKDNIGLDTGQLVFLSTLAYTGVSMGTYIAGSAVDRYGCRSILVTCCILYGIFILCWSLFFRGMPYVSYLVAAAYLISGILNGIYASCVITYKINYVPEDNKESYISLAYSVIGLAIGLTVVFSGYVLGWLDSNPFFIQGEKVDTFHILFVFLALVFAVCAIGASFLKEEKGISVKGLFSLMTTGSPLKALWHVARVNKAVAADERMKIIEDLAGSKSSLAEEDLIALLSDPSIEVRYHAVKALANLPLTKKSIESLISVLSLEGYIELNLEAISALGGLRAAAAAEHIFPFLGSDYPLLRSRAVRAISMIGYDRAIPEIEHMMKSDENIDVRISAALALGRMNDRSSFKDFIDLYFSIINEVSFVPRKKAILTVIAQLLDIENRFSKNYRDNLLTEGIYLSHVITRVMKRIARDEEFSGDIEIKTLSEKALDNPDGDKYKACVDFMHAIKGFIKKHHNLISGDIVFLIEKLERNDAAISTYLVFIGTAIEALFSRESK